MENHHFWSNETNCVLSVVPLFITIRWFDLTWVWCNAHQKIPLMGQIVDANKQNLHSPIINCPVVHPNTLDGPNMTKMQCTPTDSTDESNYQCNQSKISNEPVLEAVLSNQNILTISWSISFDVTVLITHIDWYSTHKDQTWVISWWLASRASWSAIAPPMD